MERPARSFDLYPETVGGPELLGSFTVYGEAVGLNRFAGTLRLSVCSDVATHRRLASASPQAKPNTTASRRSQPPSSSG